MNIQTNSRKYSNFSRINLYVFINIKMEYLAYVL